MEYNKDLLDIIGEYSIDSKIGSKTVLNASGNKYLLYCRSRYSSPSAIWRMSKFSLGKIITVTENLILEQYVPFEMRELSLNEMVHLLKRIHSEKNEEGTSLVHGDFSESNTTAYNKSSVIFDSEHVHWDNIYVDLGRLLLRVCKDKNDIATVFNNYFGHIPLVDPVREGLLRFCDWQYMIRKEKDAEHPEISLIRKHNIFTANNDLDSVMENFKSEVLLDPKLYSELEKYDWLFSTDPIYNSNPFHDRFKVAESYINKIGVNSLLDIGVGRGHFYKRMKEKGFNIKGIEPSKIALKNLDDTYVVQAFTHMIPFDNNSFDAITCLDVLEHIPQEYI